MATSLTSPHFSLSLKNPLLSLLPAHSCLKFTRDSSSSSSSSSSSHFRFGSRLGVTTNPPFSAVSSVRGTVGNLAAVVTADSWEESVVNSIVPVLVEFYASWCGPCKMVHQVMEEIAGEYAGKVKCFSLNTDNDPQVTRDYEIKAVPVVLIFKNGEKCESVVGTMPKEFYQAAIEKVLKL